MIFLFLIFIGFLYVVLIFSIYIITLIGPTVVILTKMLFTTVFFPIVYLVRLKQYKSAQEVYNTSENIFSTYHQSDWIYGVSAVRIKQIVDEYTREFELNDKDVCELKREISNSKFFIPSRDDETFMFSFRIELKTDLIKMQYKCRRKAYFKVLNEILWDYSRLNGWRWYEKALDPLPKYFIKGGKWSDKCHENILNGVYVYRIWTKKEKDNQKKKYFDNHKSYGYSTFPLKSIVKSDYEYNYLVHGKYRDYIKNKKSYSNFYNYDYLETCFVSKEVAESALEKIVIPFRDAFFEFDYLFEKEI